VHTNTNTNHIHMAPICGATEALDDSQSSGRNVFKCFLKTV